jgi:hypothetical protein
LIRSPEPDPLELAPLSPPIPPEVPMPPEDQLLDGSAGRATGRAGAGAGAGLLRTAPGDGSSAAFSLGATVTAAGAATAGCLRRAVGRAAALRLGAALAVERLAVERLGLERAAGRLAVVFRVVERRAVALRVDFLAAGFLAAGFLAVDFLVDLLVEDFFFAAMLDPPDSAIIATICGAYEGCVSLRVIASGLGKDKRRLSARRAT